jgi:hypothetical protein
MNFKAVLSTLAALAACSGSGRPPDGGADAGDGGASCLDAGDAGWSISRLTTLDAGYFYYGLALVPDAGVVVTGEHRVFMFRSASGLTELAGDGVAGYIDGPPGVAEFDEPSGLAVDHDGRVLVGDLCNDAVRLIAGDGTVSTVARGITGIPCPAGPGFGLDALSLAVDDGGRVYVARMSLPLVFIGTIDAGGFRVLAGGSSVGDGGVGFQQIRGLAADPEGGVYVADYDTILRVSLLGGISTVAGSGQLGSLDGRGEEAEFGVLEGLALGPSGDLYVADSYTPGIRAISPDGLVTTLVRTSGCSLLPNTLSLAVGPDEVFLNSASSIYEVSLSSGSL